MGWSIVKIEPVYDTSGCSNRVARCERCNNMLEHITFLKDNGEVFTITRVCRQCYLIEYHDYPRLTKLYSTDSDCKFCPYCGKRLPI